MLTKMQLDQWFSRYIVLYIRIREAWVRFAYTVFFLSVLTLQIIPCELQHNISIDCIATFSYSKCLSTRYNFDSWYAWLLLCYSNSSGDSFKSSHQKLNSGLSKSFHWLIMGVLIVHFLSLKD